MRIDGAWQVCDDTSVRPTFLGEVKDARGDWLEVLLLADCGADRTVFSADVFDALGFTPVRGDEAMAGIGGTTEVLGRDITNLFTLVVDRPNDAVCLLSRGEVYHA